MNITEPNIAIKTNYRHIKANTDLITTAKKTLSPVAFEIYRTISSFADETFITTSIDSFAKQLNVTLEQFSIALEELIKSKYLNYSPLYNNGETYYGNAFEFVPDNSLVAVVPSGYVAKTNEEFFKLVEAWKKPYYYTGKVNSSKEMY